MASALHRHVKIPWLTRSSMNQIPGVNNSAAWAFAAGVKFTKASEKGLSEHLDKVTLNPLSDVRPTDTFWFVCASKTLKNMASFLCGEVVWSDFTDSSQTAHQLSSGYYSNVADL